MTVAVAVKVWDGIVLATDSASTLSLQDGLAQVYNHGNKTFQFHRRYPIGGMTWGLGALGSASISSVAKDLRMALAGETDDELELEDDYQLTDVVEVVADWFDRPYQTDSDELGELSKLGIAVAGYSGTGAREPELYEITFSSGSQPVVTRHLKDEANWIAFAQSRAAERLFKGADPFFIEALSGNVQGEALLEFVRDSPVVPPMPVQDAINFAEFLADVTAGYSRYILGPNTVGGAIDVAAITRHEGFKWVERKHYYRSDLNPYDQTRRI